MVGELVLRFPPSRDDTAAEAKTRVRLLMEDLSDALDPDAVRAAIDVGKRVWRFLPTCAEVVSAAAEFVTERREDNRRARVEQEWRAQRALPAPVQDPVTSAEILADCIAKIEAGYLKTEGRPMPGSGKTVVTGDPLVSLRAPTEAELTEIAGILAAKPAVARMYMTDADYAAIGMDVPAERDPAFGPSDKLREIADRGRHNLPARRAA